MSWFRLPKCNHSLNANRNYGNATRPRLHNRQGSRSVDCLLRDGSQAARHRACPRLRRQEWPRGASRPQGLRTGRPRILLAQAGRCRREGCAHRLCRQERSRGERVLRGSIGGGRDRQRQARRAPALRSPLLRCERFRSRRLESRGGVQELATPPIIEPAPARMSSLTANPSATVQRPLANAPANWPTKPANGISSAPYRAPAFGSALSLSISTATVE